MAEMTFYVGMPDAEMHAILEAEKKKVGSQRGQTRLS